MSILRLSFVLAVLEGLIGAGRTVLSLFVGQPFWVDWTRPMATTLHLLALTIGTWGLLAVPDRAPRQRRVLAASALLLLLLAAIPVMWQQVSSGQTPSILVLGLALVALHWLVAVLLHALLWGPDDETR
ncbi:MAG: hypothetical protein KDI48_02700 [Xanthomonadales bacterium]|nr:hypothetical protein [Xanthomonadales bacterium]